MSDLQVILNQGLRDNLASFWEEHGVDFALHWSSSTRTPVTEGCRLMMPPDKRLSFVRAVVPDIKDEASAEDPTDLFLPELNLALLQVPWRSSCVISIRLKWGKGWWQ